MSRYQFSVTDLVTERMVKIHSVVILGVCVGFGALNMFSGALLVGILIVAAGLGMAALGIFPKRLSLQTRGMALSVGQILVIIVMSTMKHELHGMFPLMIASISIAATYFEEKILLTHIIIIDAACVLGVIFNDLFCGGAGLELLIKGIAGINVAFFLIRYLVKISLKNLEAAMRAERESAALVNEVEKEADESMKQAQRQRRVVQRISSISGEVSSSSAEMREIADQLSGSTVEQKTTIISIAKEMERITAETKNGMEQSGKASAAARRSTELLTLSNADMEKMVEAMGEIEKSSSQIIGIVNAIEDIAFQTNILSLNASVEAARAGEAGKSFAVVADEVRNLAGKSQDAVGSTSTLIDASMEAVKRGRDIADRVAENMNKAIASAKKSEEYAEALAELNSKQAQSIGEVQKHTEDISRIIEQGSQLSERSSEIANAVAEQVGNMDAIVREFR